MNIFKWLFGLNEKPAVPYTPTLDTKMREAAERNRNAFTKLKAASQRQISDADVVLQTINASKDRIHQSSLRMRRS